MAAGTGEVRLGLLEQTEPDFPGAGEKPGVQIWRIEQLEPVALPTDEYGKFRTGDSYICLKTTGKKSGYEWELFFWLGEEATADVQKVAAYKTMELDDKLGGATTQHREVQHHESEKFMSCFPSVEWPVAAGAKGGMGGTVKLMQLSDEAGSIEVEEIGSGGNLAREMLKSEDVLILDTPSEVRGAALYGCLGSPAQPARVCHDVRAQRNTHLHMRQVFVWVGKGVSPTERRAGMLRGVQYVRLENKQTAAQRLRPIRPSAHPARSSAGRPPASASLGQPRPASASWQTCSGWPAVPALFSTQASTS